MNWRPGQTLPISRNEEEATEAELQIAMVHIIRWNSLGTEPITIRDQKPVENPVPGSEVFTIAMKEIAECLTAWGLATLEGNRLSLTDAGHSIPEQWEYWSTANRNRRISHFKKQDTKKHRSRHYKKYKELYDKY